MNSTPKKTLAKKHSLKSTKLIDELFINGQSFITYPIRVVYVKQELNQSFLVSFSVPKKRFKLAVDRNRIKRLMRESFRQQQHKLKTKNIAMMWLYMNPKMPDKKQIDKCVGKIIDQINLKQKSID